MLCVGFKHCIGRYEPAVFTQCFFCKKKVLHITRLASATVLYNEENAICWQSTYRFQKFLSVYIYNLGRQLSRTAHPLINCMKAAMWTKSTFWH